MQCIDFLSQRFSRAAVAVIICGRVPADISRAVYDIIAVYTGLLRLDFKFMGIVALITRIHTWDPQMSTSAVV